MNFLEITCPYCWQSIEIEEPSPAEEPVEFVTDCEVCCRPIKAIVTWLDGDEPHVEAEPES